MDNNVALKKGFTVLEVTLVIVILGGLLTMVIGNCMNFINRAKFQATVREMGTIAEAAIDYYNSSSNDPHTLAWPISISSLAPTYMPKAVTSSPLGGSYQMAFANNMVTVSTVIPKGIGLDPMEGSFINLTSVPEGDQISITRSIPNEFSGRLSYDLKYLYKQ